MAAKTKKTKSTSQKTGRKFSAQHVVKRHGHTEAFDERKIYASVYEACHAAQLTTKQAEKIAANVSLNVKKWISTKDRVSSHELHQEVTHMLKKHHADVSFMYATHRVLC